MGKFPYLIRRPSGMYVVRLVVPVSLRQATGRAEVHRSTGCRDLALAKIVAGEFSARWHERITALKRMDLTKLQAGSADLLGDGTVPLVTAAERLGAQPVDLVERLLARHAHLWVRANAWRGYFVDDRARLEIERDAAGRPVAVTTDEAALQAQGEAMKSSELLRFAFPDDVLDALLGDRQISGGVFWQRAGPGCFVIPYPGITVAVDQVLVQRSDVSMLRDALLSQVSGQGRDGTLAAPAAAAAEESIAKASYARRPVSRLTAAYIDARRHAWQADELERQRSAAGALVELSGDAELQAIDRERLRFVAKELQRLPARRDLVRREHGDAAKTWRGLIAVAEEHALQRMSAASVKRMVEDMQAIFDWGRIEGWLRENPAERLAADIFRSMGGVVVPDHKRRDPFSESDLQRIFSAEWFQNGAGRATAKGAYYSYRPHYYWLPLMGLYTGGRINELAQLYLGDIRYDEQGGWYLDFNLDAPDKRASDGDDVNGILGAPESAAPDKRLKTTNASRQVPLHDRLVELGLIEYKRVLEVAGHQRLFPELKLDERKGYGKAPSSWFNDRFLGRELNLPRDGRKVFHSFRHNFKTALERARVPERAMNQLAGHAHLASGEREAAPGYVHVRGIEDLRTYIDGLSFELPTIARFKAADALLAIKDALGLKRASASSGGSVELTHQKSGHEELSRSSRTRRTP